jgi:transcriptional regulator with XRE-family HTH domain
MARHTEHRFYTEIGENIKTARVVAGKSQQDVAEFLGITFQQLQKYESGKNRAPVDRIVKIADYLRIPLSQLVPDKHAAEQTNFAALAGSMRAKEFQALLAAWQNIKSPKVRADILQIMKHMAN